MTIESNDTEEPPSGYRQEAVTVAIGACPTCHGTRRLINRDGQSGMVPTEDDDPREITATWHEPDSGSLGYHVAKIGEVCPCPSCAALGGER